MKKPLMKKASTGTRGYVMGNCSCPCSCSVAYEYGTSYQVVHYIFILQALAYEKIKDVFIITKKVGADHKVSSLLII